LTQEQIMKKLIYAIPTLMIGIVLNMGLSTRVMAQSKPGFYNAIPLPKGSVTDMLSDRDIPTGQKGFAKDYTVEVQSGDRIEIFATSESFDTIVSLLGKDGDVVAENDDGESEGTNSLLFYRVKKAGTYTIRVQSFGGSSGGKFTLSVTKLKPVE
jgi:hypothetical protein